LRLRPNHEPKSRGQSFQKTRQKDQVKAAVRKAWDEQVKPHGVDFSSIRGGSPILRVSAVIRRAPRDRVMDDDNAWASLKYYRDEMARCLGVDDKYFKQKDLTQEKLEGAMKVMFPLGQVDLTLEW
jgi:hypothetical protein